MVMSSPLRSVPWTACPEGGDGQQNHVHSHDLTLTKSRLGPHIKAWVEVTFQNALNKVECVGVVGFAW